MIAEDLVKEIIDSVLEYNMHYYKETMENCLCKANRNDLIHEWKCGVDVYSELSIEQRDEFFSFCEMVMTDTMSSMLSIIDGNVVLPDQNEQLKLMVGKLQVNGDLQDIFLEMVQSEP